MNSKSVRCFRPSSTFFASCPTIKKVRTGSIFWQLERTLSTKVEPARGCRTFGKELFIRDPFQLPKWRRQALSDQRICGIYSFNLNSSCTISYSNALYFPKSSVIALLCDDLRSLFECSLYLGHGMELQLV